MREANSLSLLLSVSWEGDMSIHTMDNQAWEMAFPLKHYRGISVVINLEAGIRISAADFGRKRN